MTMREILFAALITLVAASAVRAGTEFTYQGQLQDNGQPYSGDASLEFELYDAGSGGTLVAGPVTPVGGNPVSVSGGLFQVVLDFGQQPWTTGLWLQVTVDGNLLSPRQPLTAVPHALGVAANSVGLIEIDSTQVQRRIDGVCGSGSAIGAINADGTVSCESLPGDYWALGGNAGTTAGTHFLGTTDFEPLEIHANGSAHLRIEPTNQSYLGHPSVTANVIAGSWDNSVSGGARGATIAGGGLPFLYDDFHYGFSDSNEVHDNFGVVGGGLENTAGSDDFDPTTDHFATVGGGRDNYAAGYATTSGGESNSASGESSTVGGGRTNSASGPGTTVGGGQGNSADGNYSLVSGGINNTASGLRGTVGGGVANTASADDSTVSGGSSNTAGNVNSTVAGGVNNVAGGQQSSVGGGAGNMATALYTTVDGGEANTADNDYGSVGGGANNTAGGQASTVGGGDGNTITGDYATIAGGQTNAASGFNSSIGGGSSNAASSGWSTIAGGRNNAASASGTTVSGGIDNIASASGATVAGGHGNTAQTNDATVSGGTGNTASGNSGTVAGGTDNCAGGSQSFAIGQRAKVRPASDPDDGSACDDLPSYPDNIRGDEGTFVWADNQASDFVSTGNNQFLVRASGGIFLGATSSPSIPSGRFINTSSGAYLSSGGTWTNSSSRELKTAFEVVDPANVLERVVALPLHRWEYRASPEEGQHLGPVAEDFHAAFGLGPDDKTISSVDSSGVALAAIQGLHAENGELRDRLHALEIENAELRALLSEQGESIAGRLGALEAENDRLRQRLDERESRAEARLAALEVHLLENVRHRERED